MSAGNIGSFGFANGVLTIGSAKRVDSGQYSLQATNNQGSSRFNFTFNVQCKYMYVNSLVNKKVFLRNH